MKDSTAQQIMDGELRRQSDEMELIASENYVSQDVMTALGSILTNKYAEGYPGKRYYAGQEFTDQAENLAIARAKELFNAGFVNVQPLSGAPANFAAYLALLEPGQKIMGMDLAHGGHLTHGSKVSATSKVWQSCSYGVDVASGLLDYDEMERIAQEEKPDLIVAGFSAYPQALDWARIKKIADSIGARTLADVAHIAGFVAAGLAENPLDHGFDVMTTTTHKTLRGPRGGLIMTNDEELAKKIDFSVFPGFQGGPHMNNILAKAVAFGEALQPAFKAYAQQCLDNAKAFADELMQQGVTVLTGGTVNHIVLINCVESFDVGGKLGQDALEKAGLSTNRNGIPGDTRKPFDPSGIRLGTPAMTTRGFGEEEFREVARIICEVLKDPRNEELLEKTRKRVAEICSRFPLP